MNSNDIPDECEKNGEPLILFRRGDANADGAVNIADGVPTLSSLFAGMGSLSCRDAADVDDSGEPNVADASGTGHASAFA